MINSLSIIQNKTVEAKIKLYVHLQRAGEGGSPAERSKDKWIAEGEVNGDYTLVSETCAYVTRQEMCQHFR